MFMKFSVIETRLRFLGDPRDEASRQSYESRLKPKLETILNDRLTRQVAERGKQAAWKHSHPSAERRRLPTYLPYANPENWSTGELVELIYHAEGGEEFSLGTFRELVYRHGGRKLVPETGSTRRQEHVTGGHWLKPRVAEPPPPMTEVELQELRNRLNNILEEWDESE